MELLLVLAVIIAIGAIAAPVLTGTLGYQRLKKGGDLVRAEFTRARVRAINDGDEYAFVFAPGTGNYAITRFSNISNINLATTTLSTPGGANFDYGNGVLPRGVTFFVAQQVQDSLAQEASEDQGQIPSAAQNAILFYPNGQTQSASLQLQNDKGELLTIQLRGLTGIATIIK